MTDEQKIPIKRDSDHLKRICPQWQITADKREIKDFPKLPSATSFIRRTLVAIALHYFTKGETNEKHFPIYPLWRVPLCGVLPIHNY
ncbi:MAG: hypothetical protein KJ963_06275 [Bacteroidetes bacterium]|nr:hypothetical protein [Bacteroidota bacterium]